MEFSVESLVNFTPLLFVFVVVVVVQILKIFEQRFVHLLSEKGKDIVYSILAGIVVALLKFLGVVELDWGVVLPLLFAPQGVYNVLKKILEASKK